MSRDGSRKAWRVADRVLLARTCSTCGQLKGSEEYPCIPGASHRRQECRRCHQATSRPARVNAQNATSERAVAKGQRWSQEEDDLLQSTLELPAAEVAEALGRTLYATIQRRYVLHQRAEAAAK